MKHRVLELTRLILGCSSEFAVPGDHLKHCFLDLPQVEFWASQEQKMSSQYLATA